MRFGQARLRAWVSETLLVVYEPVVGAAALRAAALWDLYKPLLFHGLDKDVAYVRSEKARAWQRLKRNLRGPVEEPFLVHYVPWAAIARAKQL